MIKATSSLRHSPFVLFVLLLSMLLASCSKSDASDDEAQELRKMDATLSIVDVSGRPLEGVTATVITTEKQTAAGNASDATGNMQIADLTETTDYQLQMSKPGFATQVVKLTTPSADTPLRVDVTMIEREPAQTFAADQPADLDGKHGTVLQIAANALVDANGNPVSGDVDITMTPVDVSGPAGLRAFPGSFTGVAEGDTDAVDIMSFGTVEFQFTQDGEELNLAPGQTATIELPLYVETHADGSTIQIGDTIPLWYLNEDTGVWEQEGEGIVVENFDSPTGMALRGVVSHFSWWNADAARLPGDIADVVVTLYEDGVPVPNQQIEQAELIGSGAGYYSAAQTYVNFQTVYELAVYPMNYTCLYARYITVDGEEYVSSPVCLTPADASNPNLRIELNINIEPMAIEWDLPDSLTEQTPVGADGEIYGFRVTGALPPVQFSIVSGVLPRGVELGESNGRLYGTPDTVLPNWNNPTSFIVRAVDALGREVESPPLDLFVYDELTLDSAALTPVLYIGQDSLVTGLFTADGGRGPLSYRPISGGLPPGLSLDAENANVEGTPSEILINGEPMLYNAPMVRVQVKDQNHATAEAEITLATINAPHLIGTPASPIIATTTFTFTPTSDRGPVEEWEIINMPAWASFDYNTGTLSGTPQDIDVGDYPQVRIIGHNGLGVATRGLSSSVLEFDLEVVPALPEIANIPDQQLATGQTLTLQPSNIGGPATGWSVQNAPGWLSIDSSTGELSGTPTQVALHTGITVTASNASGSDVSNPFQIEVVAAVVAPQLGGVPNNPQVGLPFAFTPGNSGGQVTTWGQTGTLPPGLSFTNGTISGTPTAAGTYAGITITASNTAGADALGITLNVDPGAQSISFAIAGPIAKTTNDVPFTNVASGGAGSGAISYSSNNTAVATVNSSTSEVTLVGVGTAVITATKAADANYAAATANYSLNVTPGAVVLSGTPPATVSAGQPYSFVPVVVQGQVQTWSVQNLPSWATFGSSDGSISGTPPPGTEQTDSGIVITATNSGGLSDSIGPFSITVQAAPPSLSGTPTTLIELNDYSNINYSFTPQNVGGGATSWEITNQPSWSTFNSATGELSGVLDCGDIGEYADITITAINAAGSDSLTPFTITASGSAPLFTSAPNAQAEVAQFWNYSYNATTCSITGAADYTVNGTLPSWLTVYPATRTISGIPPISAIGSSFSFSVTASNLAGTAQTATFTIQVSPPVAPILSLRGLDRGLALNWSTHGISSPAFQSYNVYLADAEGVRDGMTAPLASEILPTANDFEYVFSGLNANQPYYATVSYTLTDASGTVEVFSADHRAITAGFNDTGVLDLANDTNNDAYGPGTEVSHPWQDAMLGADAVRSGNQQGFKFSYVDGSGAAANNGAGGCVLDETTGLLWEYKGGVSDINPGAASYTRDQIQGFIDTLNAQNAGAGYCGRTDWRVPTSVELQGILDYNRRTPTLAYAPFVNVPGNGNWWALEPSLLFANVYRSVQFGYGNSSEWLQTNNLYLLLVSGTPAPATFMDNGDGTVTDTSTGLMWKTCVEGRTYNAGSCDGSDLTFDWVSALQRAVTVNGGAATDNLGYDDWRVPNLKELSRILDLTQINPAVDASVFPNTAAAPFWTSTPGRDISLEQLQAWSVDFSPGQWELQIKSSAYRLRLVRDALPTRVWYEDSDGDGYGDIHSRRAAVFKPAGYVDDNRDCAPDDANISPAASETVGDGIDNNCNGQIDESSGGGGEVS